MAEAQRGNSNRKDSELPVFSGEKFPPAPTAEQISRMLNLREATNQLGLTIYAIYAAVHRGELEALQRDGQGRVYYSERQLVALRNRLTTSYPELVAAA